MTEREAIGKFQVVTKHSGGETWEENNGIEVIEAIYKSLRSSKCKNCELYDEEAEDTEFGACKYLVIPVEDFGCLKFERKEDDIFII